MIDLRRVEKAALSAQKSGNFKDASEKWEYIIRVEPRWEAGYAFYYLADCYVRLGKIDLAESAYRKAFEISPEDSLFSDALDSFVNARSAGHI